MYQLISDNLVKRLSDGATIPLPANESEGRKYEAWLAEGNTPLPVPGPTAGQVRAERIAAIKGRLSDIDLESIRPLRADPRTHFDSDKLAALGAESIALRAELSAL